MERKRKKTKKKGKLHWGDAGTHETRGESVFFFEEVRGRGRGSLSFFKDRLDGSVEHVATSCRLIRALSREKGEVRRSVGDARGRGGEGEAMLRDTVEEIRIDVQLHPCILFLCILFFSLFFFALFKFYGSLYKDSLGDVYRDQCFEGFLFLYRKFESLKVVNMGGWKEKKKRVT